MGDLARVEVELSGDYLDKRKNLMHTPAPNQVLTSQPSLSPFWPSDFTCDGLW